MPAWNFNNTSRGKKGKGKGRSREDGNDWTAHVPTPKMGYGWALAVEQDGSPRSDATSPHTTPGQGVFVYDNHRRAAAPIQFDPCFNAPRAVGTEYVEAPGQGVTPQAAQGRMLFQPEQLQPQPLQHPVPPRQEQNIQQPLQHPVPHQHVQTNFQPQPLQHHVPHHPEQNMQPQPMQHHVPTNFGGPNFQPQPMQHPVHQGEGPIQGIRLEGLQHPQSMAPAACVQQYSPNEQIAMPMEVYPVPEQPQFTRTLTLQSCMSPCSSAGAGVAFDEEEVESEKSYFSGSTSTNAEETDEETESESEAERPERIPAADLMAALGDLDHLEPVLHTLYALGAAGRQEELAMALYVRAGDATAAPAVAELLGMIADAPARPLLVQKVWQLCKEDLAVVVGDLPPDNAHGTVMLIGELYARSSLGMLEVKEAFATLLFSRPHPQDHVVSLACHLFLRTEPILDRAAAGAKMVEYLALRLKEVKGGNLTPETRQSITDVVDLRSQNWVHTGVKKPTKRTAGQKKARTAARARARSLVEMHAEGAGPDPAALWREFGADAAALQALVELAQSREAIAEGAAGLAKAVGRGCKEARDAIQSVLVASQGENPKARDALFHALA